MSSIESHPDYLYALTLESTANEVANRAFVRALDIWELVPDSETSVNGGIDFLAAQNIRKVADEADKIADELILLTKVIERARHRILRAVTKNDDSLVAKIRKELEDREDELYTYPT